MVTGAASLGCVTVVVGDRALASLVERGDGKGGGGGGLVVLVDHYLDALGEMGRRGGGEVVAVIGRLDPMSGSLESTIGALRDLGDGVRLILVLRCGEAR